MVVVVGALLLTGRERLLQTLALVSMGEVAEVVRQTLERQEPEELQYSEELAPLV